MFKILVFYDLPIRLLGRAENTNFCSGQDGNFVCSRFWYCQFLIHVASNMFNIRKIWTAGRPARHVYYVSTKLQTQWVQTLTCWHIYSFLGTTEWVFIVSNYVSALMVLSHIFRLPLPPQIHQGILSWSSFKSRSMSSFKPIFIGHLRKSWDIL